MHIEMCMIFFTPKMMLGYNMPTWKVDSSELKRGLCLMKKVAAKYYFIGVRKRKREILIHSEENMSVVAL